MACRLNWCLVPVVQLTCKGWISHQLSSPRSICGSLRTVSLDTYSSGSVDVPDSRRSSHDHSIRDVYSSTQHLPDLDEIVTDGATSSEEGEGEEENGAAEAVPVGGRGELLSVAESDDMKFRRASLTLEVGQQQPPCSVGGGGGVKGCDEGKGGGAPQTSSPAVTATSVSTSIGGTSYREAVSRNLSRE